MENVKQVISYIQNFEDLFIQSKREASIEEQEKQIIAYKKQLEQYQKRIIDIDNVIKHIYEDNISGKITDERFMTLSNDYENEQKDLKEKITQLNTDISKAEQEELDITTFIDKVRKYTNIKKLTPEIVNELIDKILIHQQVIVDGKKFQQIDIYYSGVGIISIPTNEYELENAFQKNIKKVKIA